MKKITILMMALVLIACNKENIKDMNEFQYSVDRFDDVEILRYQVPGFEELSLQQKTLIYYLNEAALWGRDILYDQNHKNNLLIRRTLESIVTNFSGEKNSDDYKNLIVYLKKVWMGNGIHHHYAEDKFKPSFSDKYLENLIVNLDPSTLPLEQGESALDLYNKIAPIIFDPSTFTKRTNQEDGVDLILTSANNYYEGVNQKEVEDFYAQLIDPSDLTPIPYGLNSKLIKFNGKVIEKIYKSDGMYGPAISKIVENLQKATEYAENVTQQNVILKLIEFYQTGDLKMYDEYSILWVKDLESQIDFVNGFTESYGDPLGMKASWESLVNFKNLEATKRTEIISKNAEWFEKNSPIDDKFKKDEVKGVSAKVITAAILAGDCYPATPIGINLPNSNWIRKDHGSKSVTIQNITDAYDKASQGNGFLEEFMWSSDEIKMAKEFGSLTDNLHTDLHECLGHGSGKLMPGVSSEALKAYGSPIEEARADLFALYYIADPKAVELGLLPDKEAYKAEYYRYILNGLMTQLTRIQPGKQIEQAHMRNRQLIASWTYEKGKSENIIELKKKNNKSYVVINDYDKLRQLFGQLLKEIQRVKSEGDLNGAKVLIETYAIKVNPEIHKEVLERYSSLNIAPYKGFVNPVYKAIKNSDGKIIDVQIDYTENYFDQNLRYSKDYSVLPNYN